MSHQYIPEDYIADCPKTQDIFGNLISEKYSDEQKAGMGFLNYKIKNLINKMKDPENIWVMDSFEEAIFFFFLKEIAPSEEVDSEYTPEFKKIINERKEKIKNICYEYKYNEKVASMIASDLIDIEEYYPKYLGFENEDLFSEYGPYFTDCEGVDLFEHSFCQGIEQLDEEEIEAILERDDVNSPNQE